MSKKLTQKQENFCLKYIECGNASESYRHAYNASRMKPETINSRSCRLLKEYKVSARVDQLRKENEKKALWSREKSVKVLSAIANNDKVTIEAGIAFPDSKDVDKINAVKVLNSMYGYDIPEENENSNNDDNVLRIHLTDDRNNTNA